MAGQFAFMKKKRGKIVKVPLAKWAKYRKSGYEFSSEEAYNEQQAKAGAKAAEKKTDDGDDKKKGFFNK